MTAVRENMPLPHPAGYRPLLFPQRQTQKENKLFRNNAATLSVQSFRQRLPQASHAHVIQKTSHSDVQTLHLFYRPPSPYKIHFYPFSPYMVLEWLCNLFSEAFFTSICFLLLISLPQSVRNFNINLHFNLFISQKFDKL